MADLWPGTPKRHTPLRREISRWLSGIIRIDLTIVRWLIQAHEIILNLSDHHPFLHTFFPYGSASAQLAETQRPDPLHKTYVKSGDDLKLFRSLFPPHNSTSFEKSTSDFYEFSIRFCSIVSPESEPFAVINWLISSRPDNYKKPTVK